MAVNVKAAPRRALSFGSFDDIRAELDRIQQAHGRGTLATTGNWAPGSNLRHCADTIRWSIDGFPEIRPPAVFRVMGPVMKRFVIGRPPPPGVPLRGDVAKLIPAQGLGLEDGMGAMREQLARIARGERMTARSPIFGRMSHEDWTRVHLGHCALHFGYLTVGE